MKRRGFLGFLGGAAVAGPAAAKSVVTELATPQALSLLGHAMPQGGYGNLSAMPAPPSTDWRVGELGRLKRLLAGDKTEVELQYEKARLIEGAIITNMQEVASLGSLSPAAKVRIANDRRAKVYERAEKLRLEANISDLLLQMAGMK